MPYHDDDEDILDYLGRPTPCELGTLQIDKKGESDEDTKTRAIGFMSNADRDSKRRQLGFIPTAQNGSDGRTRSEAQ